MFFIYLLKIQVISKKIKYALITVGQLKNSKVRENLFKKAGKVFRRRSVDSVIEETKKVISEYRADFIRIQDDVFVYTVDDWLKEFAERWPVEIGIPFYCLVRSELVTEELARYLKKAGCFSICPQFSTLVWGD